MTLRALLLLALPFALLTACGDKDDDGDSGHDDHGDHDDHDDHDDE